MDPPAMEDAAPGGSAAVLRVWEQGNRKAVCFTHGASFTAWVGVHQRLPLQRMLVEFANAPMRADDKGKREGIPVLVGIGSLAKVRIGMKRAPVAAVVGGDVRAVGADGDPCLRLRVVGDGGAVAVRRGNGKLPMFTVERVSGIVARCVGLLVVSADRYPNSAISKADRENS